MHLIKFTAKSELRKLFKADSNLTYSSLFYLNNDSYIVISGIKSLSLLKGSLVFINHDNLSRMEETILRWGSAEISNDSVFIQFETNSTLMINGRQLILQEHIILRSFTPLAEIFAILNYNLNSFSDGGKYNSIDLACARIEELVNSGAEIIDLGVQSTGYAAETLDFQSEIERLKDLLPEVISLKKSHKFKLSIDTYHPQTVAWLNDYAVDIINDVSGNLPLSQVKRIISDSRQYVLMHSLVVPSKREVLLPLESNPAQLIYVWLENKLAIMQDNGIDISQVIFDCGVGFGKNAPQSWYLINNLRMFSDFPCEILLGHSRKSLFNHIKNSLPVERDLFTAVSSAALMKQVDYFRLHDLELLNQIYPVLHQLRSYSL